MIFEVMDRTVGPTGPALEARGEGCGGTTGAAGFGVAAYRAWRGGVELEDVVGGLGEIGGSHGEGR